MPKRKVQFFPGEIYHIYNRGNAKRDIFYNDRDRYRFLQAMYLSNSSNYFIGIPELERNKKSHSLLEIQNILKDNKILHEPLVKIIADCLMPNHFHFLVEEIQKDGIVRFMQRLGSSYGKYFTIKYERPGSLFQGRFKAVHMENDNQLTYLLAYINVINPAQLVELNLKEKGIKDFDKIWKWVNNYPWSTHFEYMNKRESIIIDKGLLCKIFPDPESYIRFVKDILLSKRESMYEMLDDLTID